MEKRKSACFVRNDGIGLLGSERRFCGGGVVGPGNNKEPRDKSAATLGVGARG